MDKKAARERILKLREEIGRYRYAYHVLDKELISDAALDSLKKELFDLELQFPDLITADSPTQRVGGKPLKAFKKVRHETPMISFNDAFSEEDMRVWFGRIETYLGRSVEQDFYCELKIDGLAMELVYENGLLTQGSTRGNGMIGEDVTQNLKTVEAIPLKIEPKRPNTQIPNHLVLRGEVFLSKKEFERINAEQEKRGGKIYANPRNVAAGSIRQLNPKITASRKLDSFEYAVITDLGQRKHEDEHHILEALGFKTNPHNKRLHSLKEVFEFRNYWETHRESLPYEIDGIVVIVNDNATFEEAGVVGKAPRGAIAYKFSPREATTEVREIRVQVGRTGTLTPVAVLKPINVGGVTVSHATLHNADEIERLGIRVGDTVVVSRAGDVIPQITRVLEKMRTGKEQRFVMPKKCPRDGSPVVREGALYRCSNVECGARVRENLYHFVARSAFDIRGMGPKIIDRFLDEGIISDAADIFEIEEGDVAALERFGEKSAKKLIQEIRSHTFVTLARFFYSLGILHVGEETARALSQYYPVESIGELIKTYPSLTIEQLQRIPDVGPKVAESIVSWFRTPRNIRLVERLRVAGIEIERPKAVKTGTALKGITFVITGTLASCSREEAKERIRLQGGQISESVSSKTGYLIAGENPGSKYQKAMELGVPVLDEKAFLKLLG